MNSNGDDFSNWFYRKCIFPKCDGSAHWEHICKDCLGYACGIHFLPNPVQCVICWQKQNNEDYEKRLKDRQKKAEESRKYRMQDSKKKRTINRIELHSRKQKTKENKKLKKLDAKNKKMKKLEAEKKSEIDIYFEISFFRKLNLHRIRRKKQ